MYARLDGNATAEELGRSAVQELKDSTGLANHSYTSVLLAMLSVQML